jgi:hypothetical protein
MAEVPVAPVVEEEFSVEKVLHQRIQYCGFVLLYTDPDPEFPKSFGSYPGLLGFRTAAICNGIF